MSRINGLETLTSGIPLDKTYLLYGPPGAGKTTFALSFLAQGLKQGDVVALVTERPADMIIEQGRAFGIPLDQHVQSGRLMIFEYPDNVAENSARAADEGIVEEFRAVLGDNPVRRVVIDTITPLLGGLQPGVAPLRFEGLVRAMQPLNATCFLLVDSSGGETAIGDARNAVQGVLRFELFGSPAQRRLTVERFPDPSVVRSQVSIDLVPGVGMVELRPSRTAGLGSRAASEPVALGRISTGRSEAPGLSGWFSMSSDANDAARILVVHPDATRRGVIRSILEREATVVEAPAAVEALRLVQQDQPDLVIVAQETRGASGAEIAVRLRQMGRTMPIIVVGSRLRRDGDVADLLESGVDACVNEPIDGRVLVLTIMNLLKLAGFKGRLPNESGLIPAPGRDESPCTKDLDTFCGMMQREVEYCNTYALPMTFFTLRVPSGRNWLEEMATAASMAARKSDGIYLGERGIGVLLAEAETADAFLARLRSRWKLDAPPIVDFPRFPSNMDVQESARQFLVNTVGHYAGETRTVAATV